MTRVLVVYATKHNSTAEIATTVAEVLRLTGRLEVDLAEVESVSDLSAYQAVVLGSAVYMGQWLPAAADFIRRHEAELAQRSVWLFSSGPTGEGDPSTLVKGWEFPDSLKPVADSVKPRDVVLFHGRLEYELLNVFERATVKFVRARLEDSRDWDMIRGWANEIAGALIPA